MKANTLIDPELPWIKTPPQRFHIFFSKTFFYYLHSNSFRYKKEHTILILADFDPIEYGNFALGSDFLFKSILSRTLCTI